ncbi:MAG: PTS sorbitol transporter subunit IIB, partial [Lachnospiraceae bacterium]|nr:PTS sorbitol transporter subunit IIB [Lachnospiraceae bacterium]
MKRYVFATHHSMASGLKDTMEFLTKSEDPIYDVSAYMNEAGDEDLAAVVAELFSQFDPDDTFVFMTDVLCGSVNQKFFPYMN